VTAVESLARRLSLGELLEHVRAAFGGFEIVQHHTQGEFHHDLVLKVGKRRSLPGDFLCVATNCNGGVKEVLCLASAPEIGGLWRWRCPDVAEFVGPEPAILAIARTIHHFDPCELLREDARSELRPEHRERQPGGGWCVRSRSD
jgi:hypothetical protein